MSEPTTAPPADGEYSRSAPTPPAASISFWEDLVDIFVQPAAVFRRRERASVWPPLLTVTLLSFAIALATTGVLQPIFDAEFSRASADVMRRNPQVTPQMLERGRRFGEVMLGWGSLARVPITVLVISAVAWLVGKLVGARQTFHAALVVVSYAYMARVVGALLNGVQGLLMDPAALTSQYAISLGPARFVDPDATNKLLLALLGRLDLVTIWFTVLLAVGIFATGRVSKIRAAAFGVSIWIVASLPALRSAYMQM